MDGSEEDDVFSLAAKAVVDSILACEVSGRHQAAAYHAFRSILSFRVCIAALPGSDVLLSSNLLLGGEVMFTPVEAETSCAREVASQCRPSFITGSNASLSSDLAVILKQESCKAFFCVPLPTNYQPAVTGQASTSTASTESVCLGAIIIGFQSENEVAEQDLRAALLIARHIAVNHHSSLESLVAGIAPILNTGIDPNYHPGWGNAGGLLRPSRRERNASSRSPTFAAAESGAGASGAGSSRYIDTSIQDTAEDTSDGEELPQSENSNGALVLNPIQHALLQSTHRVSLSFPHLSLERQYQEWRGARMAGVDGAALATLLAYHCTRTLASSARSATNNMIVNGGGNKKLSLPFFTALSRWEYLPCTIIVIPLTLTLFPVTHRWYSQRRDIFVAFLYLVLAYHHIMASTAAAASAAPSTSSTATSSNSVFDMVAQQQQNHQQQHQLFGYSATQALIGNTTNLIEMLSNMDSIWISVLSVILNVRHPWQTLILLIAATASALIGPDACPGSSGDDDATVMACWVVAAAKVIFAQMLIPGIALYWLECGARRAFCATPSASYFAWRLEGARTSAHRR